MFVHNFKYALKSLFRNKTTMFWTLIFPIGLTTFMFMAFHDLMKKEEMMEVIPVAVVDYQDGENGLLNVLEILSEGDDPVLRIKKTDEKKAKQLLQDKSVEAIIDVADIRLVVNENGYNALVLQVILEQYKQKENIVKDILKTNPGLLPSVAESIGKNPSYYVEQRTSDSNQDQYNNYFYAIFAMACLFSSFVAVERIGRIQANVSPLGMRRCLSPNPKFVVIVSEYLALLMVQFAIEVITLIYMTILGIDFGNQYPAILLILLLGCSIGLSMGVIIGSISKMNEAGKTGLAASVTMILSVMADLCTGGIKDMVEHNFPILNRINPAVLISDSFYALNVYDNYTKYFQNIGIMAAMSILLVIISSFILRRNRYASV